MQQQNQNAIIMQTQRRDAQIDLGSYKYEELGNGQSNPFLKALKQDFNLYQLFLDQQEILCNDISKDLLSAHRSTMQKLEQDVERLEQDCNMMNSTVRRQNAIMDQLNIAMRTLQNEETKAAITIEKIQESQYDPTTRSDFFANLLQRIQVEMDVAKSEIKELYLALRPEEAEAVARRDRYAAQMEQQRLAFETNVNRQRQQMSGRSLHYHQQQQSSF
jgi:hypothetical protein